MDVPQHVVVSRNDAVGDIILALPVCGLIKEYYPSCQVSVLGRTYTRDIALSSAFVDEFINEDDWKGCHQQDVAATLSKLGIDTIIFLRPDKRLAQLAQLAGIKTRVGTFNRIFHWFTCNKLVWLSRKNSFLHEAQLNIKLLEAIGINKRLELPQIPDYYGLKKPLPLKKKYTDLLDRSRFNLIIHPKSNGNSLEWSLEHFSELIRLLSPERFKIFITGSEKEREQLRPWLVNQERYVTDVTGFFSLQEFISFISMSDGLLAASTGPLHIAAALGIHSLGLYTDIRTKEAFRWGPIGKKAEFLQCVGADMNTITVEMVYQRIMQWL